MEEVTGELHRILIFALGYHKNGTPDQVAMADELVNLLFKIEKDLINGKLQ